MRWLLTARQSHFALGRLAWRVIPLLLVALVSLALASSSTAAESIRITAPADGSVVAGPDVTISLEVGDLKLVPGSQATKQDDLHVHYILDADPSPYLDGTRPVPTGDPNIIHSAETSHTFVNLKPGPHKVTVLLTNANHLAVKPTVAPSVSFTVGSGSAAALPRTGGVPVLPARAMAVVGGVLALLGLAIRWRHSGALERSPRLATAHRVPEARDAEQQSSGGG